MTALRRWTSNSSSFLSSSRITSPFSTRSPSLIFSTLRMPGTDEPSITSMKGRVIPLMAGNSAARAGERGEARPKTTARTRRIPDLELSIMLAFGLIRLIIRTIGRSIRHRPEHFRGQLVAFQQRHRFLLQFIPRELEFARLENGTFGQLCFQKRAFVLHEHIGEALAGIEQIRLDFEHFARLDFVDIQAGELGFEQIFIEMQ